MSGNIAEIMGHKVDIRKVSNRVLRRVIRERKDEFMFLYGDHDEYNEEHKEYSDHREKYKEHKEHREYVDSIHTDEYYDRHQDSGSTMGSSYGCVHHDYDGGHSDHSEKKK